MSLLEELQNAAVVIHTASNSTAVILCNKDHINVLHLALVQWLHYTDTEKGLLAYFPICRKIK